MTDTISTVTETSPAFPTGEEAATEPGPLVHIGHFRGRSGLGRSPLSSRVDDPKYAIELAALKAKQSEVDAAADQNFAVPYWSGSISWLAKLGLFSASAPAGRVQRFLGYFPQAAMAERAIREFELAADDPNSTRRRVGRTRRRPKGGRAG